MAFNVPQQGSSKDIFVQEKTSVDVDTVGVDNILKDIDQINYTVGG